MEGGHNLEKEIRPGRRAGGAGGEAREASQPWPRKVDWILWPYLYFCTFCLDIGNDSTWDMGFRLADFLGLVRILDRKRKKLKVAQTRIYGICVKSPNNFRQQILRLQMHFNGTNTV